MLSDTYEKQFLGILFREVTTQLLSCNCQAHHSFRSGHQYVIVLMYFWSYLWSHWGATFTNSSATTLSITAHRVIHKSWQFHVNNAHSERTHKDLLSPQKHFCMNYKLYAYLPVIYCCQVMWEVCPLSLTCEIWIQNRIALKKVYNQHEWHMLWFLCTRRWCGSIHAYVRDNVA